MMDYSNRKNIVIFSFLLLFSIISLSAQTEVLPAPPREARGFNGEGLHLYPLGWSSEGRWGTLIGISVPVSDAGVRLLIIDAVTDEVLFRSKAMDWSGPGSFADFWTRYGRSILEKAASFDLESTMGPDVRDAGFITGGVEYEFVMSPASPARGAYKLRITSSRGDGKDVFASEASGIPEQSALLGALVSPFEARALAILREVPAAGSFPFYRFSGAHLILGFKSMSVGSSGWTATRPSSTGSLISAVFNGQEYLVRTRLAAGVDPESEDSRGYTALLLASRLGHWRMVVDLLEAGASPHPADAEGRTALHHAAFAGSAEAVQALLGAGADSNIRDTVGRTAVELAASPAVRNQLK